MMRKREDRFTIEKRLKYTCGWTTKEIAWQAESDRRIWMKEHNPERTLRDWMRKHLRKEFLVQTISEEKFEDYLRKVCQPVTLTENIDGLLHNGDVIRLKWPFAKHPVLLAALPKDVSEQGCFLMPTRVTGTEDSRVVARNTFCVYRNDAIPSSVPLMYGECLYLRTIHQSYELYLSSEMKTYNKFADLSGNQEVSWKSRLSPQSLWVVKSIQSTKKLKDIYIPVNSPIILTHVLTNQNLVLEDYKISTLLGVEYEISAKNYDLNPVSQHKNIWTFEAPSTPITPREQI